MDLLGPLLKHFGHSAFRGIQAAVIERIVSGGHSLVVMPTGGGKSLCYQLPAIILHEHRLAQATRVLKSPLTLVISPLIALMKDQVDNLVALGVSATFVNSSLTREQRVERYQRLRSGEFTILYVTPERFRKSEFRELLEQREVVLLAVDEAHCISQWGHDFRPDYTCVGEFRSWLGDPPTIALTATATREVQLDIVRQLNLGKLGRGGQADCQLFHTGIERPNLELQVQEVWGQDDKLEAIVDSLKKWSAANSDSQFDASTTHQAEPPLQALNGSGIIYFTLIRTLEEFSQLLRRRGIKHLVYHGDLARNVRRQTQEEFMLGQNNVVLATNAFGMGVDKEDIRFVIHAEVPASLEAYYQEVGRAGRDGLPAQCNLLYDQNDLMTQMEFIRWSNPDADFYQRAFDLISGNLEAVRAFGYQWLHEKMCHKQRHDRRLTTVLSMMERYGVLENAEQPIEADEDADWSQLSLGNPLPAELLSRELLSEKLDRDQRKLLALVQYIKAEARVAFLNEYFGAGFDE